MCRLEQEVPEKPAEGHIVPLSADSTFKIKFGKYICQMIGLLHLIISMGKVKSGKGGKGQVESPRVSFAPLCFALLEMEKSEGCIQASRWYEEWLKSSYPRAHATLMQCSVTISDFKESGKRALRGFCAQEPVHGHCAVHMIRNCTCW